MAFKETLKLTAKNNDRDLTFPTMRGTLHLTLSTSSGPLSDFRLSFPRLVPGSGQMPDPETKTQPNQHSCSDEQRYH